MIESFNFIGFGGSGSGVNVWQYLTKTFGNDSPDSTQFIQIWDPNDPLLPEPASAHVMLYGSGAWKDKASASDQNQYPPSPGVPFGYRKYLKGTIPQRVYAWRGWGMASYPYDYNDLKRYCGFNTSASLTGAMMLPNVCKQSIFHETDHIASDAETHHEGNWTHVFNGGNGHYWNSFPLPNHDGPGSSGSIFGRGYDGGEWPAGSGGPGTDTARGPAATHLADGVLEELGFTRRFIQGKPAEARNHGDNGDFEVNLPPDLFLFSQLPFQHDTSLLKLPASITPGPRDEATSTAITFGVILEFKQ